MLCPLVEETLLKPSNRGLPLLPIHQLLVTLRYYATGNFQLVSGDLLGISQPTISRIIKRVSETIASNLRQYVRFPEDSHGNMLKFYTYRQFPNVSSCIDGTHIPIKNPGGNIGEVFRNRKRIFSINVQVACGPNLEIMDIVARYPGSMHDNTIFARSVLRIRYENRKIPGVILGDNGYGNTQFLFTPVLNPRTRAEENYNRAHKGTRNIIERCFGVWKGRFLCLREGLTTNLQTSVTIICATAVLHNIALLENEDFEEDPEVDPINDILIENDAGNGVAHRNAFILTHFGNN
ncbi:hypothetical protein ABEB36_014773 [Hypothenemus hampei]|uniref:Putative nuclease HARBI1 n=1 Tax=Hypothenemus hampei TaxID=57062 RepID=A0ABD1E2V6_HYPHA